MPDWSFVADGVPGEVWPLRADDSAASGWRLTDPETDSIGARTVGADLDDWLAERSEVPLAQRIPVLAYGSNRCPSKIGWLRTELGLTGAVAVLRVRVHDVAAVWAAGIRMRDDQRPATLAASPGTVEEHVVWLASPEQLAVLDVCESRGVRYRLVRLHSGVVEVPGRMALPDVWTYVGTKSPDKSPDKSASTESPSTGRWNGVAPRDSRLPLLVDGAPVRCADVPQAAARALVGRAGTTDGLSVSTVDGIPDPMDWPAEVFVYGTLQPGASAWQVLAPFGDGAPRRTTLAGTLFDTGKGYPGLTLPDADSADGGRSGDEQDSRPRVPGWAVRLREPAAALPVLDAYEGPQYRRVRRTADDGSPCWAYLWSRQVDGMPVLSDGWQTPGASTE